MGMISAPNKGPAKMSYCAILPTVQRTFYAYQINGAAWMLMHTLGGMPINLSKTHKENTMTAAALTKLNSIQTFGGLVVDQTGLGKTIQVLLFLAFYVQFHHKTPYKPILLVVPTAVICQWADEIATHWSHGFELIIAYSELSQFQKSVTIITASDF